MIVVADKPVMLICAPETAPLRLEPLERFAMFRLEYLNDIQHTTRTTRAQANEELTDALQKYEMGESARFDRMEREREKPRRDR
jgi:hypothetical protein